SSTTCTTTTWGSCWSRPSPTSSTSARAGAAAAPARTARCCGPGMDPGPHGEHGHSHGLIHDPIKRSREGVRAVLTSLGVLGVAALAQTAVFVVSGSVALLADLIHNFGDALTAVPLGIAFVMRSERAERTAGLFVVAAIFISACVAGVEAVSRLIHRSPPTHLGVLALAGAI